MRVALCWRMLAGHSRQVIKLVMKFHISNGTIISAEQVVPPNFGDGP